MAIDPVELRRRLGPVGRGGSTMVQLEGFAELEAKLKAMGPAIARRASLRAMRRAGKIMADEMRQTAPAGPTGALKDSIVISARTRNTAGFAEYSAALRAGHGYGQAQQALRAARAGGQAAAASRIVLTVGSNSPLAHLVEFGTVERFHKSGKSVGAMPANPFVRAAWEAKKGETLLAIKGELTAELARLEGRGPRIPASAAGLVDG